MPGCDEKRRCNETSVLGSLPRDGWLLLVTRGVRMFAYGFLSVVLALYLRALGFREELIGLLLTLTLLGDTAVSLAITVSADRIGRRRMLILGAVLMALAGLVFGISDSFPLLLIAAIVGVISPSGKEVGPFLSIEQAALAQTVADRRRTDVFAWQNVVGSMATALGALASGLMCQTLLVVGFTGANVYRPLVFAYGAGGILLATICLCLTGAVEAGNPDSPRRAGQWLGLHRSRRTVFKLAGLFGLDALGGGFVIQSLMAYWFYVRFGVDPVVLGGVFFGANLLAAASALIAASLARRIGLVNTMVFTHLPSNVLLILVPLMPNLPLAITVVLLRFSISQMDVPTRQSYTMAVVQPNERSAAAGVTTVVRSVGAGLSPALAGYLLASPALLSVPFFLAGGIKIVYDLLLYRAFITTAPPEERDRA